MHTRKNKFLNTEKASDTLKQLLNKQKGGQTTISDLLEGFHENGFVFAMIFFALPVAIPLPYPPGFTTIMGTPLMVLAFQMLMGYEKIMLPSKINRYTIKNSTLIMIADRVVPILRYMEKYTSPRFGFARSVYCEQLVGVVSLICALSVAIPLPFTNAVPALGIVVMSLGLLSRDGLVIIVGALISIVGLLIAMIAMAAGWVGIKYLFNLIL